MRFWHTYIMDIHQLQGGSGQLHSDQGHKEITKTRLVRVLKKTTTLVCSVLNNHSSLYVMIVMPPEEHHKS